MELKVIGTGSAGNCYILENANSALIIEAGVSFKEVQKAMNFESSKIKGVIYSHKHMDHYKYVAEYLSRGYKVYGSEIHQAYNHFTATELNPFTIGEFIILPFELEHDVRCFGYQIDHTESGRIIFMTDTKFSQYRFDNVNQWIVECNHSEEILYNRMVDGNLQPSLYDRIIENHMSLETLIDIFGSNNLVYTQNIILVHGSDSNSHSDNFKKKVIQSTGKQTYIAEKGLKLNLTLK